MSECGCPHEQLVVDAASAGSSTPQLAAHVAVCPECADVALVSGLLRATEPPRDFEVDLSQAAGIWRRAETRKRREEAAKALRPVAIGELAACALGTIALAAFATRSAASLSPGMGAMGQLILADPLLTYLGAVAAALLVGAGFLSFVLVLGFGAAKS